MTAKEATIPAFSLLVIPGRRGAASYGAQLRT
jgi:hypothetical protein